MEVLLWLVPPAVVTLTAMAWVTWLGRDGRGEVDPEVANARLAAAMRRHRPVRREAPQAGPPDRSTGIAVRPSRRQVEPPPGPPPDTRRSA